MFEFIRKHSKSVMFVMFLLVIPSFVLVGIDSNYFSEKSPVVARVAGHAITQQDWDYAHSAASDRIRAQSPDIDPKVLDGEELKRSTLDRMIRDRLLNAAVNEFHLNVSDAALARRLHDDPAVASLRSDDGSFDLDGYEKLLASQGLKPSAFEAGLRRDISMGQVLKSISDSTVVLEKQAQAILDPLYQQRSIQFLKFDTKDFKNKINPSDEDLLAFYQKNSQKYKKNENIDIEYVVLDNEALRSSMTVDDEELKQHYAKTIQKHTPPEERKVSHILFNADKDISGVELEKIQAKANDVYEKLKNNPDSFAKLAKDFSEDATTAKFGGDLGFLKKESGGFDQVLTEAAFALREKEVSEVIRTDFGFDIIKVDAIKKSAPPSFEDLKAQLKKEILDERLQKSFIDSAELFTNEVFDKSDSLEPVAQRLKLEIKKMNGVERTPSANKKGVTSIPLVVEALFSNDVLLNKRNTSALEIGVNQLLSARVVAVHPEAVQSFDEVKTAVRDSYIAEKAFELAKTTGEDKLKLLRAGDVVAENLLSKKTLISREKTNDMPTAVIDEALKVNAKNLPAWTGLVVANDQYFVIKINEVIGRDTVSEDLVTAEKQQLKKTLSNAESMVYYDWLKKKFKVEFVSKK